MLHGYEGGKFLKERTEGRKGNLRKVRILKHVACETLLRVTSTMIWEICCGGGGGDPSYEGVCMRGVEWERGERRPL